MLKATIIDPPPIYTSNALAAGTVVAIVPSAIAAAIDAPQISASREVTLHMAAPASDLVASPSTVAAPQKLELQIAKLEAALSALELALVSERSRAIDLPNPLKNVN